MIVERFDDEMSLIGLAYYGLDNLTAYLLQKHR